MKIDLPEKARRYIEAQIAAGRYRTPADLIGDLVRQKEQQDADERRLWERQRQALLGLLSDLSALPTTHPGDGFTNRDHDCILYSGEA